MLKGWILPISGLNRKSWNEKGVLEKWARNKCSKEVKSGSSIAAHPNIQSETTT